MKEMTRAAEAIIDRTRAGSGDVERRYRLAEMEIHFAMRDEFGPANAALFAERGKKLHELAGAVGRTKGPEPPPFAIDDFVRETRSLAQRLRDAGLAVEEAPVSSRALLWDPDVIGWELTASDPKRTVSEEIPYAGTAHGPPKSDKQVPASVHLYVFPHVKMSASQSMVKREQPGTPVASGAASVIFRLQAAPSRDQDPDGAVAAIVEKVLPGDAVKELPAAAKALGAGSATLERGLLRVTARGEPPAEPPGPGVPEARIVLWSVQRGVDVDLALLPLTR